MANVPEVGYRIVATVIGAEGHCSAGHCKGDSFEISCHDSGGLCGFFYHDIFPSLQTLQFGGRMPWWRGEAIQVECPDRANLVTLRLDRFERETRE
jgi:uncharacterized repeat protein (TIGR04076 family)